MVQLSQCAGGAMGGDVAGGRLSQRPLVPGAQKQPTDPPEVRKRGPHDVNARVAILDPVDGYLVNPQAAPLRKHEQLRVEEPAFVFDKGQEPVGDVRADRLEAALCIGKSCTEDGAQQLVIAA